MMGYGANVETKRKYPQPQRPYLRRHDPCRSRRLVAISCTALILTALWPVTGARAHPQDVITAGRRIGPIHFGTTSLRRAKAFFGEPTVRKRVPLGCIRAIKARWGRKLTLFFTAGRPHVAIQGTLRKRRIMSDVHGALRIHTRKGLRVGDSNRRLRRLYPNKAPVRHRGHFDYFLRSSPKLVAITKYRRGRVRALFSGPYENC
jgi:hypothetical protein